MSRPKPTREDDAAREARIDRYGHADSDFTPAELAQLRLDLEALILREQRGMREARRRQKAAQRAAAPTPR